VTPGVERQVLALASLNSIADVLTGQGIRPELAKAAAAAAVEGMRSPGPDLRLELAVSRAASAVRLVSLQVRRPDGSGVVVTPKGDQFAAVAVGPTTRLQVRVVHGQMDSESFYASAVAAGLSDALIPAFFQAFVYDFDFQREIGPGDVFEAALEENLNEQGEAIGTRRLLYASMTTKAKSRALYAFAEAGAQAPDWFDGDGRSIHRSLMRTPVEGARISSGFGMRLHPVLGFTRMHKGTDFATPVGTPVFASGDGVVEFVGLHDGHGNYIRVRHSPTLETAYAHLSKYETAVGASVRQGQEIALSGNSGLTSGPHLHYEVIVNGEQVDSQSFQTEQGHALAGDALKRFMKERDRIDALRSSAL
jgi:murein DD-endopeptidase MepM/ murein hydrolase activator NlpD